jgi:hypothetical protein
MLMKSSILCLMLIGCSGSAGDGDVPPSSPTAESTPSSGKDAASPDASSSDEDAGRPDALAEAGVDPCIETAESRESCRPLPPTNPTKWTWTARSCDGAPKKRQPDGSVLVRERGRDDCLEALSDGVMFICCRW